MMTGVKVKVRLQVSVQVRVSVKVKELVRYTQSTTPDANSV